MNEMSGGGFCRTTGQNQPRASCWCRSSRQQTLKGGIKDRTSSAQLDFMNLFSLFKKSSNKKHVKFPFEVQDSLQLLPFVQLFDPSPT